MVNEIFWNDHKAFYAAHDATKKIALSTLPNVIHGTWHRVKCSLLIILFSNRNYNADEIIASPKISIRNNEKTFLKRQFFSFLFCLD